MQVSPKGRLERLYRRCAPAALEAVAPALIMSINALGAGLQKLGIIPPPGPKTLPPNLLKDLPPVVIDRPIVIVPGYNTSQDRFSPLAQQLAQPGHNGDRPYFLKGGQVFLDAQCSQALPKIPSDAKVFVSFSQKGADPPPLAAQQLAHSLRAIQSATGCHKVDVAAYSMGGLSTRYCIQQGEKAVGKLLMVGTPNQGSQMSLAALKVLDLHKRGWPVSWIMSRKPIESDHGPALSWLSPAGSEVGASRLGQLNQQWPEQAAQLEKVGALGTRAVKTLDQDYWRIEGDGQVSVESMSLPGLTVKILEGVPYPKHRFLFSNPEVQAECKSFFGWREAK